MATATMVILTYDRREMLRWSLAAALTQTQPDLEIVVVDNGSTDGTGELLATITDPRVRVRSLPHNINPTKARNMALDAISGEWVGFCDDDDLWAPDKAMKMLTAADRAGAGWGYCGCVYLDGAGMVTAGHPPPPRDQVLAALPVSYTIPGGLSGIMWHRDALDAGGRLDESLSYTDDWDLALRLRASGDPAVVLEPLVGFRQHAGSWSRGSDARRHEFEVITAKHAGRRREAIDVLGWRHHRYVAAEAARTGSRREAVTHYLAAIRQGDQGSIPRLAAVVLPQAAQRWARRRFLSDNEWMAAAEDWVRQVVPIPVVDAPLRG